MSKNVLNLCREVCLEVRQGVLYQINGLMDVLSVVDVEDLLNMGPKYRCRPPQKDPVELVGKHWHRPKTPLYPRYLFTR